MKSQKITIQQDPYRLLDHAENRLWGDVGTWPCRWVTVADDLPHTRLIAAYRLEFTLEAETTIPLHVTANERYRLFCDGEPIGEGPERGSVGHWYFESFVVTLPAGAHRLTAWVWSMGDLAAMAQMTSVHGFLLGSDAKSGPFLNTGTAAWQAKVLTGIAFVRKPFTGATGAGLFVDGRIRDWEAEKGGGQGWSPVRTLHPGCNGAIKNNWMPAWHRLYPGGLPAQTRTLITSARVRHVDDAPFTETEKNPIQAQVCLAGESEGWQALLSGVAPLTIPPHTTRRVIVDFGDYQCAHLVLKMSGGRDSMVRIHWAEALYENTTAKLSGGGEAQARGKGNRHEIEGKCFIGDGDQFVADGGDRRIFETLWWSAGRYVEIAVETQQTALVMETLSFFEARYPLEGEGTLEANDPRWKASGLMALRTLQMCAHETYMDCPYYEQLQYVGDTRIQMLASYVITGDTRLQRKTLEMLRASIDTTFGLTRCSFPNTREQFIPPFTLWWVGMVYDYALWRGDPAFIRTLMPDVRRVVETFVQKIDAEKGLLRSPDGWNFTDWVPAWTETTKSYRNWGVPPGGNPGDFSAVLNWHLVYTLKLVAELETWLGEPELAQRANRFASSLVLAIDEVFWDAPRNLYADDVSHHHFSEHAQCLALLSKTLSPERSEKTACALYSSTELAETTIYFSHYLFETVHLTGNPTALFAKMESLWFPLLGSGMITLPEEPEPCRSDCHAWGAHPLYHFYATVLGVRPTGLGSQTLTATPCLGPLQDASGTLPHVSGLHRFHVKRVDNTVKVTSSSRPVAGAT